jgi:AcrR family transcriptional regulator
MEISPSVKKEEFMTNEGKRSTLTRNLIKKALIDLLLTESFNSITVKQICEKAEVNRSTFYTYFKDPDELLAAIEDDTVQLILNSFNLEIPTDNIVDYIDHFLGEVKVHHEAFKVLLGLQADASFSEKLMNKVAQETLMKVLMSGESSLPTTNISQLFYYGSFYMSGAYAILVKWINSNYGLPSSDIAAILRDMLKKCFNI